MTKISEQGLFFENNKRALEDLYTTLAMEWTGDLEQTIEDTQPWARGGDHSIPAHSVTVSEDSYQSLGELFAAMDLVKPLAIDASVPENTPFQVWLLGGMHNGNLRRAQFLAQGLERTGKDISRIVLMGGERPIYHESGEDRDVAASVKRLGKAASWFIEKAEAGQTIWETDMLRLAATEFLGPMSLASDTIGVDGVVRRYDFSAPNVSVPITLLHTPAVQRMGKPRHTTEACVEHAITELAPDLDSHVVGISTQPHALRTARSMHQRLRLIDRPDITVHAAGPRIGSPINHNLVLGEIARNLYEDGRQTGLVG
jgi:hypothetical protein